MIVTVRGRRIDLHRLTPWVSAFFLLMALAIVYHEIRHYHWHEIVGAVTGIRIEYVGLATLWSVLAYLALTAYDFQAMRYIGRSLPPSKVMLASFIGFAVSNNAGHAVVSGGAVRLRFYGAWGLSASEIVKIVLFTGITYLLGAGALFLIGFAVTPADAFSGRRIPLVRLDWLVAGTAIVMAVYVFLVLSHRRTYNVRGVEMTLPTFASTLWQTLVGAVDLLLASLVFYTLLVHYVDMPFGYFLGLYVVAQVVGLISQVPGGIGVFEGIFLYLVSSAYPPAQVLGSLIVYRILYYFLPLAVAGALMIAYETGAWRKAIRRGIEAKKEP